MEIKLQSDEIGELMAALSKAQGEFKNAVKDSKNPFFKSNYADLASVKEATQDALTKYNLAVTQTTNVLENGMLVLITTLGHSSGQWKTGIYPINPVKNDPQGIGSAITYGRRYAFTAITGVVADDDDGEAAQGRPAKKSGDVTSHHSDPLYTGSADQLKQLSEILEKAGITSKEEKNTYHKKFKDSYTMVEIKSELLGE